MKIHIADYDPVWPQQYESHRGIIAKTLGDAALCIEHIGSTAVPGLAAKPIIDIVLVVENPADESSPVGWKTCRISKGLHSYCSVSKVIHIRKLLENSIFQCVVRNDMYKKPCVIWYPE
jgi:GrpB-like predicted nucleotidyltransferase (UPF0157 family)